MPATAPFPSPQASNAQPTNATLYPALYLYPLNDTWAPKHITLTNQHTKIGRQTSSKTAPGERNGFFDSKVLSRQHAEVWEDNGKIYIKDVRSSNGTFINGERLSSEGQESEPFELKSDDIVEFGIDIVGEDNKTIIHHKVAARVVCVFNEQDAQVAARAEQHQQQQQQFLQQQSSSGPSTSLTAVNSVGTSTGIIAGAPGGPQNFPFTAQRRVQLAQQGLGGMGAMRPPGKTGLSFDVILGRLQGELQKSRETGAELNSLTGTMSEIHDTLGGNLPANLPPLPNRLPPVRSQEASVSDPGATASSSIPPLAVGTSKSMSTDQPSQSTSTIPITSVQDLQVQVRDARSSLESHLERVRVLEQAFAEQEVLKREVKYLKEEMEARRMEIDIERAKVEEKFRQEVEQVQRGRSFGRPEDDRGRREGGYEPRGGFDLDDDEVGLHDVLDDDDETRSIATAITHELERVDEEDEDELVAAHEDQFDEPESVQPLEDAACYLSAKDTTSRSATITDSDPRNRETLDEEEVREGEDFTVGRPRTPEPRLSLLTSARRPSMSSPHPSTSDGQNHLAADLHEHIAELSKRLADIMQQTSTLEARYTKAHEAIGGLQNKVVDLETMLDVAKKELAEAHASQKEAGGRDTKLEVEPEVVEENQYASLVEMMTEWKKSVEGQWGSVREEWTQERDRLSRAREEFENRLRQVDTGIEKVVSLQTTLVSQQQQMQAQLQQHQQQLLTLNNASQMLSHPFLHLNGDAVKHHGGLVTPPSPRSQSSDSCRYRRRRRRSSGSRAGSVRMRSSSGGRLADRSGDQDSEEVLDDEDADTDATLASSTKDDPEKKSPANSYEGGGSSGSSLQSSTQLATPASSVGSLDVDNSSARSLVKGCTTSSLTHPNFEAMNSDAPSSPLWSSPHTLPTVHLQTAAGVVLLSIAAAAVFWKVKPE